ncbi:response regulator transcription factor [Terrarubrum flagellatum]|uniref:response regulator transcription factor n=1 Tax=Terrirubrum flagellatum TaxID=2895980 RepID=UPI0031455A38
MFFSQSDITRLTAERFVFDLLPTFANDGASPGVEVDLRSHHVESRGEFLRDDAAPAEPRRESPPRVILQPRAGKTSAACASVLRVRAQLEKRGETIKNSIKPKGQERVSRSTLQSTRLKKRANAQGEFTLSSETAIIVFDERVLIRDCFARGLQEKCKNHAVFDFTSVEEWEARAGDLPPPAVFVLSAHEPRWPIEKIERDLFALTRAAVDVPVVIVSDSDDINNIMAALVKGARGFITTNMPLDVAIEAVRLVEAGGTFVPASSLTSARSAPAGAPSTSCAALTERQVMVVEALHRGKANKQIAYELNMRESTVKAHIRHIMKKLKARNRTEIAALTSKLFNEGGRRGPGADN